MITLGQKLKRSPSINVDKTHDEECADRLLDCMVVYIHPLHRYYTVEFRFPFGAFRESYLFEVEKSEEPENVERKAYKRWGLRQWE